MSEIIYRPKDVTETWRDWLSDILGVVAVLVLVAFLFSGCGGGTSGTGISGDSSTIAGRVRDETGSGVGGVLVTIPELEAQTITDEGGEFAVEVQDTGEALTVELTGQGVDSSVPVNDIPEETETIDVSVTVDSESGAVSDTTVNIVAEETPPGPAAPPEVPFQPSPEPTPSPTAEPLPHPPAALPGPAEG